jgi:hypothetical protein
MCMTGANNDKMLSHFLPVPGRIVWMVLIVKMVKAFDKIFQ